MKKSVIANIEASTQVAFCLKAFKSIGDMSPELTIGVNYEYTKVCYSNVHCNYNKTKEHIMQCIYLNRHIFC